MSTVGAKYLALLDIKAIIRKWQDLDVSDQQALDAIAEIIAKESR